MTNLEDIKNKVHPILKSMEFKKQAYLDLQLVKNRVQKM